MSKKKVVIASVLKPVNDTRMYEKLGLSLAATKQYNVNIIGFKANAQRTDTNIKFHPIFDFRRLSLARLFCGFNFYKTLKKLNPDLIIINTHELLWPAIIFKIFHRSKVVYDVLENHFRNLLFTNSFPLLFRPILAMYVRAKEYVTAPFIDHFFLAEKYYDKEISFTYKRHTILENKFKYSDDFSSYIPRINGGLNLIFSGTLAQSTGVFGAIKLAKKLHQNEKVISLKIIGYSPKKEVINQIKKEISDYHFIQLIGGDTLVNHQQIIEELRLANFGIIYYPTNKSTINCTPTKLYEYLSNQLPIIMNHHEKWAEICAPYNAAITINFENIEPLELLSLMRSSDFYPNGVGDEFSWVSEEKKLLEKIPIIIS